jgi:paraquat-inducible protein B
LASIDKMLSDVQPQVGPLLTKLNETATQLSDTARAAHRLLDTEGGGEDDNLSESIRQLTEAARSIRSLTDYLGRHPEALIRGKKEEH